MQNKLLPCPFCGGEAEWGHKDKNWIRCKKCSCESLYYENKDDAIKFWNTRKPIERIVERLEEVKMNHFLTIANTGDGKLDFAYEKVGNAFDKAIEIVKGGVDNAE